jgi:hypothetical protein
MELHVIKVHYFVPVIYSLIGTYKYGTKKCEEILISVSDY